MTDKITILVVEDNDVTRQLIAGLLEARGYDVVEAAEGGAALKILRDRKDIGLAVIDQMMSPVDGFEFTKSIRRDGINLPIIMATADKSSDLLIEANKLGIKQVLYKPINQERLIAAVERVLQMSGTRTAQMFDRPKTFTPQEIMQRAVDASRESVANNCAPFGAVVATKDGRIIAEGTNKTIYDSDPTAHAEVVAIRSACKKLNKLNLEGHVIYCSSEPCALSIAAIYWANLDKIYYANAHETSSRSGFDNTLIYKELEKPPADRMIPSEQLAVDGADSVFEVWRQHKSAEVNS